jgi:hypothetical protein
MSVGKLGLFNFEHWQDSSPPDVDGTRRRIDVYQKKKGTRVHVGTDESSFELIESFR